MAGTLRTPKIYPEALKTASRGEVCLPLAAAGDLAVGRLLIFAVPALSTRVRPTSVGSVEATPAVSHLFAIVSGLWHQISGIPMASWISSVALIP